MRFVFRTDASVAQGSGHVMRCLTLAEELVARGHEVAFVSAISSVGWLAEHLHKTGLAVYPTTADELSIDQVLALKPNWVIVDSYRIPSEDISRLSSVVKVLAIVDGETRGIDAHLYLEQNLGSERRVWPGVDDRMLAGSAYALIRDSMLACRPTDPSRLGDPSHLVAFMGGTDPDGVILRVAEQLDRVAVPLEMTIVAATRWHDSIRAALPGRGVKVIEPTTELPVILGSAHVVVSAAGTSAWDVCTLGIPSVFVGVVDNQAESLGELTMEGLALGIDLTRGETLDELPIAVQELATNDELRSELSHRCATHFDGKGKVRVVDAMESYVDPSTEDRT